MQPKSIARPPKRIGLLKRWWLFYEGSFAGSMLETVSAALEERYNLKERATDASES
jgi:hypothetical protein